MPRLTVSKDQVIAESLTRHANGESLRDIAPAFGISHVRLRAILLGDVPDAYKQAQQDAMLERIAEADELLDQAIVLDDDGKIDAQSSNVNIARAREIGKFARFDAERRLPQLFGQRQQASAVTVNVTIDALAQARQALQGRVIDITPTTSSSDNSQDTPE
jgi:hypothetical protein